MTSSCSISSDLVLSSTLICLPLKSSYNEAIGASIQKKYAEAGFKIAKPDEKTLPNLDVAVFSGTLKTKIKET